MSSSARSGSGRASLDRITVYAGIASAMLAVAALVGFIVVVGSDSISDAAESSTFFIPAGAAFLSTVALALALVGLFVRQEEQLPAFGVAGFVIALAGTIAAAGGQWTYLFVVPHFADAVPEMIDESTGTVLAGFFLSYAVLSLGWIIFGIAMSRAGMFRRNATIATIVGAVIAFVPMPSRTLVLSLAVAYLVTRPPDKGSRS